MRSASLGETAVFDVSHSIIQSSSSHVVTGGTCLERLLSLRSYVNEAIRFSAYDDRWVKASDYLFRGSGNAFGQTVGFAALSRSLGMPARAAGGILLADASRGQDPGETWNQVYVPPTGWIDIGTGRDYGHAGGQFAARSNRYFVTFEGDFDACDYSHVFTEKEWCRALKWTSVDRKKSADVAPGAISVRIQDLKE